MTHFKTAIGFIYRLAGAHAVSHRLADMDGIADLEPRKKANDDGLGDGDQLAAWNPQRTLGIKRQTAEQSPEKGAPIHGLKYIVLIAALASSLMAQPFVDVPTQTKRFTHDHTSSSTVGGQGGQLDQNAIKAANRQGSTGTKFAMAAGSFTAGHCRVTDADGNEIDGACGSTIPTLGPLQFLQGKPDQTSPTLQAADLPYFLTSDYDFPARTPGGTLTGGSPSTVTLTPCPLGVAGSDANHYYWISAGTGTAEAVLSTGGSCTSGASTGTVTFTPANNHGGAWTFASGSSGAREAILASGGNAVIKIPANSTLLISGANGLVIDKLNLTIVGAGYGSVIQARANQFFNSTIRVTNGSGLRLLNFTVDGNRANAGTNPTFGANIDCGLDNTGGCNHVLIQNMQIYQSAGAGIVVHDTNTDITVENNWIHDNGGVTNSSGNGVGMFVYWADPGDMPANAIKVHHNYFSENHNTVTNAGPSSAFAAQGKDIIFSDNYVINNYNDGGQVVISHFQSQRAVISGNIIRRTATALSEHTTGIETDSSYTTIVNNVIVGHTNGTAIALEGNALGPSGIGSESTTITGNIINGPGGSISLNNAGGFTRATIISANRFAGVDAIFVDTATSGTIISDNNFMDSTAPYITDNSVDGVYLSNNFPMAANFLYGGTLASAGSLNMRCGQAATVSGSATVNFIVLPAETAATLGAGCMVSLIPAAGATWQLASGGNISAAITSVIAGRPILLVSDGTNFNPLASATSLPTVGKLQYLRGNPTTAALEGSAFPFLIAADYNFTPQAPGGSLSAGVNTVTLTPCPLGVNGGDLHHYVYLSGGTGTAEAVLITSGTCASGATTGTIVFTAAHTHSGAWTVAPAQGGIFEAMNVLPTTGGQVRAPCGSVDIRATLIIGRATATTQSTINSIGLLGCGSGRAVDISIPIAGGTTLLWGGASGGTVVQVLGPIGGVSIQDLMIDGNSGAADIGLDIVHSYLSTYRDVNITGWNAIGLRSMAVDFNFPFMVAGNNSNRFDTVEVSAGYGGAANIACQFGQAVADTLSSFDFASNYISNTACLGGAGIGGEIRFADNNTFTMTSFNGGVAALKFTEVPGTGGFPTSNVFNQCPVLNTLTSSASFASITPNFFWPLTTGEFSQNLATITPFASGVDSFGIYFGKFKQAPLYYSSITSPAAIANTTVDTAFARSYSIAAGLLSSVGAIVRMSGSGRFSTTGTPALTLTLFLNALPVGKFVFAATGSAVTNDAFSINGSVGINTSGGGGALLVGPGTGTIGGFSGTNYTVGSSTVGAQAIDTTIAQVFTVKAKWGAADPANTITLDDLQLDIVYPGAHQ